MRNWPVLVEHAYFHLGIADWRALRPRHFGTQVAAKKRENPQICELELGSKKLHRLRQWKKGSLQPADFKNFRPKKFIGLQQTMNFYFNLARFSCVMSILILVSILVQCFATDVQVWFVLFTGCASFKMAGKFTLRVDIEYMRKQQTAMCKMWSSRPSNSVKTRWWPRKRVLFGWCQTIIFPLLHCATHLLFGWPSVLIALGMLVLR